MKANAKTVSERFHELTGRAGRATHAELVELFEGAAAIGIPEILGAWAGHTFGDDAPEEKLLASIRWAGKTFRAADDVDPIVCLDDEGQRVANVIAGTAHLEMVAYRGSPTATMVYDSQPMRDHFRQIDDQTVIGAMEKEGANAPGFFYLTRL